MFISKFSTENWQANRNQLVLKSAQNWLEIEVAIRSLDGHRQTLVTLETEDEAQVRYG
ncbi:MAG: hypothetical protein ACOYN8_03660 [Pseudanabaena sp.]|jgi:hypothetical protein